MLQHVACSTLFLCINCIIFCGYTKVCLFNYHLMDICVFTIWGFLNNASLNIRIKICLWTYFHYFGNRISLLDTITLGWTVTTTNLLRNYQTLSKLLHYFTQQWTRDSISSMSLPTLVTSCHFDYDYPGGCEVLSRCSFDMQWGDCNGIWCWTSFQVPSGHFCFFWEMSIIFFAYCLIGVFVFFIIELSEFFM